MAGLWIVALEVHERLLSVPLLKLEVPVLVETFELVDELCELGVEYD